MEPLSTSEWTLSWTSDCLVWSGYQESLGKHFSGILLSKRNTAQATYINLLFLVATLKKKKRKKGNE